MTNILEKIDTRLDEMEEIDITEEDHELILRLLKKADDIDRTMADWRNLRPDSNMIAHEKILKALDVNLRLLKSR